MSYEAVNFDLDGTLVHQLPEYRYTVIGKVFRDFGYPFSEKLIDGIWFEVNRNKIIREIGFDLEKFWEHYYCYDNVELRRQLTKAYDDIDFLKTLKSSNFKLGMVTFAPKKMLEAELEILGKKLNVNGRTLFDSIIIARGSNGIREKPHPEGLEKCLEAMGVKKERSIYVGNADDDVLLAKNSGVLDVLIDRGEHVFPNLNPTIKINSLYDLKPLLGL